jgi:Methyltransferase FkbM domain
MKISPSQPNRKPTIGFAVLGGFALGVFFSFVALSPLDRRGRALGNAVSSPKSGDVVDQHHRLDQNDDGWKTLNIFYGTRFYLPKVSLIEEEKFATSRFFSQCKQDEIVSKMFRNKRDGYFVDLAANDAVKLSNTYALETHFGWNGICIEANPSYWDGLSFRRCEVVGAVAGSDREEVKFNFKGVLGGIVGERFDNTAKKVGKTGLIPRLTVRLEEIFQRFGAPSVIDYFSLDVEGAEDLVLRESVLSRYRFKVITLERPKENLQELLVANGYTLLKKLSPWGETLWIHNSAKSELDLTIPELNVTRKFEVSG